jgi:hypothetical protein
MTTIFIFLIKCFFVVFCLCPTMICHLFLKVPDAHISGKEEFFRKLDGLSCATNCKSFWGSAGRHELPTGDLVDFYTFERGRPNGGPNSICRKAAKFCPNCTATKSVPIGRRSTAFYVPPLFLHRCPGPRPGFVRPFARTKYAEPCRSDEGPPPQLPAGIAAESLDQ